MMSADEYYLYGSGGGGSYGMYTGFAVDAMAPQTRDLYNTQTSFYTAEKFGGGLGPSPDFEETVYACPDGSISFGSPCPQQTATPAQTNTPAQTATPVTTTTTTAPPPAQSSNQLPAVVLPLLIGLLVFAVLK